MSSTEQMAVSINPSVTVEQAPLPLEIHTATRSCHTALNRLITSRLPLCLLPHAADPAMYAKGIATIGQIYLSFEQVWAEVLSSTSADLRIHEVLQQLKIPSLLRSARLKADLSLLDQRLSSEDVSYMEEHSEITHMVDQMKRSILQKPHLIMSYTWIMYMALFNGGRWIRGQLTQAGPDFWGSQKHLPLCTIDCLSFWDFEGGLDGEDIKEDFKARFSMAAAVLNETERQDVIDESVRIFETCSQMVGWLDKQAERAVPEPSTVIGGQSWLAASYAAASSTVCGVWTILTQAMPSVSSQRSELWLGSSQHTS